MKLWLSIRKEIPNLSNHCNAVCYYSSIPIGLCRLPVRIQEATKQAYLQWKQDKAHPSLHFKLIRDNIYSARISIKYRALAVKQDDTCIWFWVGSHADYDQLIDSIR